MPWDPTVLRKYNTTGHFRLLNQVRTELKGNPLIRPRDGETVGAANRSRSLTRAIEARAQAGARTRARGGSSGRSAITADPTPNSSDSASSGAFVPVAVIPLSPGFDEHPPASQGLEPAEGAGQDNGSASFRDRLSAIDMR